MNPSRLLTPKPSILPAIIVFCSNLDQPGEQRSRVALRQKKQATQERISQAHRGRVNDL